MRMMHSTSKHRGSAYGVLTMKFVCATAWPTARAKARTEANVVFMASGA